MSSTLNAIQRKPVGYWQLGTTSNFVDYSGYGNTGTNTGTPKIGVSLSDGVKNSTIFSNGNIGNFPTPLFKTGQEHLPFTLMASVYPGYTEDSEMGLQQVVGNAGLMDGILINGTVVSFVIKFNTAPDAVASFDVQNPRRMSVAGVYGTSKIDLYIDGELVSQQFFTSDQQKDTFKTTGTNLSSGETDSLQSIAVNGIAAYWKALSGNEIKSMHDFSYKPETISTIPIRFGGKYNATGSLDQALINTLEISLQREWETGTRINTYVQGDTLYPTYNNNLSIPGYWMTSIPLSLTTTNLYGVNIDWNGVGVKVEVSLDSVNWETVYHGKNATVIPPNYTATLVPLMIRITFPGGLAEDQSFVEDLTVKIYKTGTESNRLSVKHLNERELSLLDAADVRQELPVNLFHNLWGSRLKGGSITLFDNATTPEFTVKTVEAWIKHDSTFSHNLTGVTSYVNGVAGSTMNSGHWHLYHLTSANDLADITFTGDFQIGSLSIYPTQFSAAVIQTIYNNYVGTNNTTVLESNALTITEPADSTTIYARDWAIINA